MNDFLQSFGIIRLVCICRHWLAGPWPLGAPVYCCVSGGDLTTRDSCKDHLGVDRDCKIGDTSRYKQVSCLLLRDTRHSEKCTSLYHIACGLFTISLWNRCPFHSCMQSESWGRTCNIFKYHLSGWQILLRSWGKPQKGNVTLTLFWYLFPVSLYQNLASKRVCRKWLVDRNAKNLV